MLTEAYARKGIDGAMRVLNSETFQPDGEPEQYKRANDKYKLFMH